MDREICKFFLRGDCRFGNRCWNLHQNPGTNSTHRWNRGQVSQSNAATSSSSSSSKNQLASTSDASTSFASTCELKKANNVDNESDDEKTCGICFDTVLQKVNPRDQLFGLLPNCSHCFCYACIIRWRQSKVFELEVSKSCPECRTASEYVYPSKVWMVQSEQKTSFIDGEKQRMKMIDCKYFRKGKSTCPFGNKCLYQHSLENGKLVDVGDPKPRRPRIDLEADLMTQLIVRLHLHADSEDELDADILELISNDRLFLDIYNEGDDDDSDYDELDFQYDYDYDDLPFVI